MTCDKALQIHAYHDGELNSNQRQELESHLLVCAQCRELLDELREISRMLVTVDLPATPSSSLNRMYGSWWASRAAQEQGIRRLAGWLTAAAAAILVLVPAFSSNSNMEPNIVPMRSWEMTALVPPPGSREDPNAELMQVAQWFATDLSTEQTQ